MHYNSDNINFPNVNVADMLKENSNRFLLAVGAAMRARQIKEGGRPTVEYKPNELMNFVTVALKEIHEKKVTIFMKNEDKKQGDILNALDDTLNAEILIENAKEEDTEKKKEKPSKKSRSLSA